MSKSDSSSHSHPLTEALAVEAERKVSGEHERELTLVRDLREFALRITQPWAGRPLDPERHGDGLIVAVFARSVSTMWVATDAVARGFGEQAAMLNRSLFEDMVDAHWISIDPATAARRYEEHLRHNAMLLADSLRHHPRFFPTTDLPSFDPADRAELDGVFGAFGHKPWSGINLHERVRLIEHLWTDEVSREHLHFFGGLSTVRTISNCTSAGWHSTSWFEGTTPAV